MEERFFNEVAEQWLHTATEGVCFSWKNQLASNVNHLNRHLGQKDIVDITLYDIEFIIKNLHNRNPNTNKPASKRLLKAISQTANQIFTFAVENNYIVRNPAIELHKKIPKTARTKIVEAINDIQISAITQFESDTQLAAFIMMFMGLRTGELLALEWGDFDFNNCTLSINKRASRVSSNKFEVKEGTKNGKNRIVPIPTSIRDWLENKWLQSTTDLVIPNSQGKLHTPTSWRNCWTTYQNDLNYFVYCKRCFKNNIKPKSKFDPKGIPDMKIIFNAHQLRHTFATMLYISKVDILTMKELMGHCDIQTTLGIYTHLSEKFKKVNIIQYDDYIRTELLKASSL